MENLINVKLEQDVPAQMRDGTTLYADIYRPVGDGPFPVILMRLPYNKAKAETSAYAHPAWYARHGYMVVVQDVRGRWASEGEFYPFRHEMTDGYDSVEWAARLPGANGKVGMYGFSYVGATQLLAAIMQPPHLTCICPGLTPSQYYEDWAYNGGAFALAVNLSWVIGLATVTTRRLGLADLERELWEAKAIISNGYNYLPLAEYPLLKENNIAPYYFDWLAHPEYDEYWHATSVDQRFDQIKVPALHIGGWYDIFRDGTIKNFLGIQRQGADEQTRQNQRLLIGPWLHSPWTRFVGQLDFGEAVGRVIDDMQLCWFNYWLKGIDSGLMDEPPVRVFLMGDNVWRSESQWPPADVVFVKYYLHSQGRANSLMGDGRLDTMAPEDESPDIYAYDPRLPVPSLGGHSCCSPALAPMGPKDQREVELDHQVLVYTTEPIGHDVTVMGPVTATLWAASSAVDTDFTVKLVDVYPDGRAINLTEGIIRARYRDSLSKASLLEPYQVYQFKIEVGNTCAVFKAGHRIRVEISSSNFPHWDRNTNTGHKLGEDSYIDMIVATQVIFHDFQQPSHITLPIYSKP